MLVAPTRQDWARMLGELVRQLDDGRVYDGDLRDLELALHQVLEAHHLRRSVATRRFA